MEAAASHGYAKRIRTATVASHRVAGILGFPQRRALRAAIATTICFYLGWIVIDDPVLAVFATLGVIGLLVLAEFGGDLRDQARDYVLATVIGAVLVALGLSCPSTRSRPPRCCSWSRCASRCPRRWDGTSPLARTECCCSSWSPAPFRRRSAPWSRECRACCSAARIALVAALTIWPQRPRDRLRAALADATDALAGSIGDSGQPPHAGAESLAEPVREALAGARPERVAVGERPTLASERDHAQMRVGYGLSRAQLIFERLAQRPEPPRAVADAERTLAQELQQALSATAAALRGEDRPPAVERRSTPGVRTGNAPMRRSYRSSPLRGPTTRSRSAPTARCSPARSPPPSAASSRMPASWSAPTASRPAPAR